MGFIGVGVVGRHYCSRCGKCCQTSGAWYKELRKKGSEACKYLKEPNICEIWEMRPLICNTEKLFDLLEKNIPRKTLLRIHKKICKDIEKCKPKSEIIEKIHQKYTKKIRTKLADSLMEINYFENLNPEII